jgi:bifunctional DNase/RNase
LSIWRNCVPGTAGGSPPPSLDRLRKSVLFPCPGDDKSRQEGAMELEMKIRGLMMDPVTNMPIVVLKDVQGSAVLPIWVGVYEANAIALEIQKVQTPRPMTHDLLKNVFLGFDVRIDKIVVNDLKDDTFYALICVERDGQLMTIDSRPSDALALALRMDCPIYVDEQVLKNSKVSTALTERATNDEQLRNWLKGLSDEDLGRYKM